MGNYDPAATIDDGSCLQLMLVAFVEEMTARAAVAQTPMLTTTTPVPLWMTAVALPRLSRRLEQRRNHCGRRLAVLSNSVAPLRHHGRQRRRQCERDLIPGGVRLGLLKRNP